ncbi:TetR/AcrR family transcriptional regulator [Streptomyces chartreusis]|uniref:TetR/AcrR family transcriptional regulator n=1 Tax=Streptomyces chartreusis TaxID=1969 RepID=A0A7H8TIP2_STRCX|nr:TetR/AcrR family transcriptional regulator [Streptomyces chartreusis]QKZ23411.1 TetR/AcrR family transcriptional regulator [Streptomyces chartreusis]
MSVPSMRARVRAETVDEIRAIAKRHLATDGANLSLRAVARDAGLVPSALYRYFPNRDALLTVLITDAYAALAASAKAAEAAVPRHDMPSRLLALGHGVRSWALDHPAEYALLYGSPVPRYSAPPETVGPASEVLKALIGILFDGAERGLHPAALPRQLPAATRAELHRLLGQGPMPKPTHAETAPETFLAIAFTLWTQLFGLVNFEVFGRLDDLIEERRQYFEHQMLVMADFAGLTPGSPSPNSA